MDADIRGFFDNLDKGWMIQFMEHRVVEPSILRLDGLRGVRLFAAFVVTGDLILGERRSDDGERPRERFSIRC